MSQTCVNFLYVTDGVVGGWTEWDEPVLEKTLGHSRGCIEVG